MKWQRSGVFNGPPGQKQGSTWSWLWQSDTLAYVYAVACSLTVGLEAVDSGETFGRFSFVCISVVLVCTCTFARKPRFPCVLACGLESKRSRSSGGAGSFKKCKAHLAFRIGNGKHSTDCELCFLPCNLSRVCSPFCDLVYMEISCDKLRIPILSCKASSALLLSSELIESRKTKL